MIEFSVQQSAACHELHFDNAVLTLSPPVPLTLYTFPYWSNPPFLIFDIRALWPECQKL